jgi:hypothetical protein
LKQTFGRCAAVFAFALIGSAAAWAQAVPPGIYPDAGPALPPHEVITIVRSTGLEPLGRPVRRGPVYTIRAVDPAGGEELRVIVDAQVGNVVRMVPVVMPRGVPVVRPPGRVAMAPDAYGPNARMPLPGADGPALSAAPPPDGASSAGPPLPRPRPKLATADTPADKPASAAPAASPGSKANETTGTVVRPAPSSLPPLEE